MLRETGSSEMRRAEHGRAVSPAAKLKEQIDLLRQRYWLFMSQKPPRVKAANACLIALRPLMQKQLERELRNDKRMESVLRADRQRTADQIYDIDDCTEVYG
jgi:hypothetical protein